MSIIPSILCRDFILNFVDCPAVSLGVGNQGRLRPVSCGAETTSPGCGPGLAGLELYRVDRIIVY